MIILHTNTPRELLQAIKSSIDKNRIETWAYDKEGDLTHTAAQWRQKAWLRPSIKNNSLTLNIIWPKGQLRPQEVYAIYHGRFIEMVIAHFPALISSGEATPS
jgi:hypothetical protein